MCLVVEGTWDAAETSVRKFWDMSPNHRVRSVLDFDEVTISRRLRANIPSPLMGEG